MTPYILIYFILILLQGQRLSFTICVKMVNSKVSICLIVKSRFIQIFNMKIKDFLRTFQHQIDFARIILYLLRLIETRQRKILNAKKHDILLDMMEICLLKSLWNSVRFFFDLLKKKEIREIAPCTLAKMCLEKAVMNFTYY